MTRRRLKIFICVKHSAPLFDLGCLKSQLKCVCVDSCINSHNIGDTLYIRKIKFLQMYCSRDCIVYVEIILRKF